MSHDMNDPLAVATATAERPDTRFGSVTVEGRFVCLIKGQGKVDFDPAIHEMGQRRTEIKITCYPLPESGLTYFDQREVLAESNEFAKTVWPSAKAMGLNSVGELNNAFVKYELVETGKYTKRDGTQGTLTTIKFHELYKDHAACLAAYEAERGNVHTGQEDVDGNGAMDVDMTSKGNPDRDDPVERETAKQFLAVLVKMHGGDDAALAAAIAGTPMVSKFFKVTSPEVAELRKAA